MKLIYVEEDELSPRRYLRPRWLDGLGGTKARSRKLKISYHARLEEK